VDFYLTNLGDLDVNKDQGDHNRQLTIWQVRFNEIRIDAVRILIDKWMGSNTRKYNAVVTLLKHAANSRQKGMLCTEESLSEK